ncbi:KxYKxGKxW signal peptide domain-containing protein [Leuconostoc citreum]
MGVKKYKLYKDGKHLVIGAIAVVGVMATTGISHVSADTVTPSDTAQAVKTTDTSQSNKQVTLQPAQSKDTSPVVKSDVPTSVPTNVTQDEAKKTVDTAQDTVKGNVDTVQKAGVDVTKGGTQDVTINKDNASSKANDILSDLNKQDQAVKEATAKQEANKQAKQTADKQHDEAVKQGQADLNKATNDLDKQVDDTKKAGIEVSVKVSKLSPKYQSLKGLTGQEMLTAMAKNIALYQQAVASGVQSENADKATLEALVNEYQQKQADFAKAQTDRNQANEKGKQDLDNANHALADEIKKAKEAGIEVSVVVAHQSPAYQDLKGLEGQVLLDAMAHNIEVYNKTVADATAMSQQDKQTLANLTAEYKQKVAEYQAKKAKIDKSNADKKATYDKAVIDRQNAINEAIAKGDQHYKGSYNLHGLYGGFLNGVLHYDYTYHWDNNKQTFIVTQVSYTFDSARPDQKGNGFWDAVYVQAPKSAIPKDGAKGQIQHGTDLVQNGDTLWQSVQGSQYGVMFFLSQNNKTGAVTTHVDNTSFVPYEAVQLPDGSYELARFIVRNRQGDPNITNSEYANWMEANKVIVQSNIPVVPTVPTYEQVPTAPAVPKNEVHQVSVDELPTPDAPVAPKATVTKVTVAELPQAETPAPQKVDVHYYNVHTTPDIPELTHTTPEPTPKAKVARANILPHTGANDNSMASILSALVGIAILGLLGVMSKFKKQK